MRSLTHRFSPAETPCDTPQREGRCWARRCRIGLNHTVGISATVTGIGGWTVGPVVGRRPAGVARDAVHPGTGARAVLVVVDDRFTGRGLPDPETVARAAVVGSPLVVPMLDAGILEDGSRWYVTPAAPGPVLDPAAGCSPRRAASIVEAVARALAAVHAAGLVHGLVGPAAVVPATARHADRAVGTTLLLDTGVAALLGDRAGELAQAAGVSLPNDRGPAADVHALGGLLLRLLTAAAPAGPALAALPVPLRALLSSMLDEHPSRRPTADAVAQQLAGLREGLLATGPVELPRAVSAPVPVVSAPVPMQRAVTAPRTAVAPRVAVPPPVAAPHTAESPIVVPRATPAPAPSLWTGPVPVSTPDRPRRRRVGRALLLAGGVGLAGLLVGVVTHLPLDRGRSDGAVAAAAENGVFAAPATPAADTAASFGSSGSVAPSGTASKTGKHAASSQRAAAPPAFARPTAKVPSPLAASATSPRPSRNTTPPSPRPSSPVSSAPSSSIPSSSAPSSSAPSAPPASAPPTSSDPAPATSASSAPSSSAPAEEPTTTASSSPTTPSADPTTPTENPSPSESVASTPTDSPAA
ncbi:hypothetical protein CLV52_2046 [Amnibacterium kyonggiense]|uniref:Protein kinase domain-containing protein n=1 Tax=Amnibacterium kyonggiense TaxID=595671 RepID=A0A4R7FL55_9MICO|nr:hypothetical protein CLV52_2046 [Amnibacterium kyonggiense]